MKNLILAVSLLVLPGVAMASHCVRDARAIDEALQKVSLSDEQKSQVETLKAEGLSLHQSGDHRGSESKMAEAMRLILTNMTGSDNSGM